MSDTLRERLAWNAGIYEGEGSVHASARDTFQRISLEVKISMTDLDVLTRFQENLFGWGKINGPRIIENRKPIFSWYLSQSQQVISMYEILEEWLCERRRGQFRDAITARYLYETHLAHHNVAHSVYPEWVTGHVPPATLLARCNLQSIAL